MKINKYWYLNNKLYPDAGYYRDIADEATKEQFDSVTIWHKGDNRTPIVFSTLIRSITSWSKKSFKRGLEKCFKTLNDRKHRNEYYHITYYNRGIHWGCRRFTEKDLNEIADAFEFHYEEKIKR